MKELFAEDLAIYTGIANLLNEVYGYTILPLGPVRK